MNSALPEILNPLDVDRLRQSFRQAQPLPFLVIDEFLEAGFANQIMHSYPSFAQACTLGRRFNTVNERGKVQITDARCFSAPVESLNRLLKHPTFLTTLSELTGIPDLLADDQLKGGGMHLMQPGSHLDVHVDFNRLQSHGWYRRLNLLVFLNDRWPNEWGGQLELWDSGVKHRCQELSPDLNRCVIFETTGDAFHGVTTVHCPEGIARKSFSTYYYTAEPPTGDAGATHDTIFRARPTEWFKGWALMPAERAAHGLVTSLRRLKSSLRRVVR